MKGLEKAAANSNPPIQRIEVLLDNHAAAQRLMAGLPDAASHKQVRTFNRHREEARVPVYVKWIPGHKGIKGNERADALGKEGSRLPQPRGVTPTLSWERRRKTNHINSLREAWWEENAPRFYKDRGIGLRAKPLELKMNCRAL